MTLDEMISDLYYVVHKSQMATLELGDESARQLLRWLEDYKKLKETTRWIPCSERLPEVGEPVLIYETYNEEIVVASLECDKMGFSKDDYWYCWYGLRNVPFWMPLPNPPKGDAE